MTLANSSSLNETLAYFGSSVGVQLVSGLAAIGGGVGLNATGQSYLTAVPAKLNQTYEVCKKSRKLKSLWPL